MLLMAINHYELSYTTYWFTIYTYDPVASQLSVDICIIAAVVQCVSIYQRFPARIYGRQKCIITVNTCYAKRVKKVEIELYGYFFFLARIPQNLIAHRTWKYVLRALGADEMKPQPCYATYIYDALKSSYYKIHVIIDSFFSFLSIYLVIRRCL